MMAEQELSTNSAEILVVDDSIASLRMLSEILSKAGYKSRPVEDPQLALEAALAQPPSLMLLDVRMPKMSGFELCRRLKGDERTRDVPIIFVSALEETGDRVQGFEVGGVDFISKPFQEAEVLARVKTHLKLRYTQLNLEELETERTAEIVESEARYRGLVDNSIVGVFITTPDGQFLFANDALAWMYDFDSPEQMIDQGTLDRWRDPKDRDRLLAELQQHGSVSNFEAQTVTHSGRKLHVILSAKLLGDTLSGMVTDITERVLAEQALLESEARFRVTFEQAAVGIAHVALDGSFMRLNQKFCDIVGYTQDEMLSLTFQDITHPDDLNTDLENVRRLLAGETDSYSMEKRYFRKDGEIVWINLTVSLLWEADGEPSWFVSVVEEITDRKEAEEELEMHRSHLETLVEERTLYLQTEVEKRERAQKALKESEEKFRSLYQNMPVPVYAWQQAGDDLVLVDHNEAANIISAGKISDYQGITLSAMYPDRPDIIEDITRCLMDKVSIQREIPYRFRSTGEDKTLLVKYAFVSPDLVLVQTEDITESKLADQRLRASEEKYRDLVEKVSDVIYAVDTSGEITYLNPAVEELTGLPPEELVGQSFAQLIHPDDLGRLKDNVQNLLSGRDPGPSEYRVLNPLGNIRWIRVASQPIVAGGQITGLQGVLTNITDRKMMENQIQVAAASAERSRLARDLHDSVSQTLFSAGMIADAIPRLWDKDPISCHQNLELLSVMIRGASAEMRSLLLELRPDTLKDLPLSKVLEMLVISTRARTRAAVSLKVESDCLLSDAVTLTIHRIAQESLNNIAKHAEASEVVINLSCGPESCKLCIEDDGCGFDPQTIPAGHFGIGIMRERAKKIGATFQINSKPGNGTSVVVTWSEAGGRD